MARARAGRNMGARSRCSRLARVLGLFLALPIAAFALYLAAALVLGLLAQNRDFRDAPDGVAVYVISNGVHTDLMIPVDALGAGLMARLGFAATELAGVPYLAFGWGDREFYLNTPAWSDLKAPIALHALSGLDASVVHVEPAGTPLVSPDVRLLHLTPTGFASLRGYVEDSFLPASDGSFLPIEGAQYDSRDRFYPARGHYSAFHTCNEWTRLALATAGVRVPLWSPFPSAIFYQLSAIE